MYTGKSKILRNLGAATFSTMLSAAPSASEGLTEDAIREALAAYVDGNHTVAYEILTELGNEVPHREKIEFGLGVEVTLGVMESADFRNPLIDGLLGWMQARGHGANADIKETAARLRYALERWEDPYNGWSDGIDLDSRPHNEGEYNEWICRSAREGIPRAQFACGWSYIYAEGTERSLKHGVMWYRRAAENDYAPATYELAKLFYSGREIDATELEAVDWVRTGAELGHGPSQILYGKLLDEGIGVTENDVDAVDQFILAMQDQLSRQVSLFLGSGVSDDEDLNTLRDSWNRLLAEHGSSRAAYFIAHGLYQGYSSEGRENNREALRWFIKSAEMGSASAAWELARIFGNEAQASDGYHPAGKQDLSESYYWDRRALELGWQGANYYLARLHMNEESPFFDVSRALDLMLDHHKTAWDAATLYHLGILYSEESPRQNYDLSAEYFRKAASIPGGDRYSYQSPARRELGQMYATGRGVPKDYIAAYMWLNVAADELSYVASRIDELESKMTPGDIASAQERTRVCIASEFRECQ
ncbi:MAG: sel1 repeat family protein [Rhodobacteraceae bacterium]|nr:sel1 repeat family protein [Paracoccaceae bacterium]